MTRLGINPKNRVRIQVIRAMFLSSCSLVVTGSWASVASLRMSLLISKFLSIVIVSNGPSHTWYETQYITAIVMSTTTAGRHRFGALDVEPASARFVTLAGGGSTLSHPNVLQSFLHFRLYGFGHLVSDVSGFLHPAALLIRDRILPHPGRQSYSFNHNARAPLSLTSNFR